MIIMRKLCHSTKRWSFYVDKAKVSEACVTAIYWELERSNELRNATISTIDTPAMYTWRCKTHDSQDLIAVANRWQHRQQRGL